MRRKTLTILAATALSVGACAEGGERSGTTDTTQIDSLVTDTLPGDTNGIVEDTAVSDTTTTGRVPLKHRPEAVACDHERVDNVVSIPDNPGAPVDCESHDDCVGGENGRCVGNTHDGWYCTYDRCFGDGDCSPGAQVCECGGGFRSDHNVCLGQGNCQVDADCGAGGYCSPSYGDCGDYLGVVAYYCHTDADECIDDADCDGEPSSFGTPYCAYNPTAGKWMCSSQQCAG